MTQHTPGPNWECPGKDGDAWVICAKDASGKRRTIAHAYQEPNARLIAAALEMYQTVKELLTLADDGAFLDLADVAATPISRKLRALLARIEGR